MFIYAPATKTQYEAYNQLLSLKIQRIAKDLPFCIDEKTAYSQL